MMSASNPVVLTVNADRISDDIEPRQLLVDFLRDVCELTGTKIGCEDGSCGACTVLLDGRAVRSCLLFTTQAADHAVETIEGLGGYELMRELQQAFRTHHAVQCGFCAAGMLLTSFELLAANSAPSELQVREALCSVVCRCTGYDNLVQAVLAVAGGTRERDNETS